MRRSACAVVLVMACGGGDEKPSGKKSERSAKPDELDTSKIRIAKLTVDELAMKDFPMWAVANASKACPDSLGALLEYAGKPARLPDPWGQPYKMMCGKDAPKEARGIAVVSFGPDKQEGTADDIKSWERPQGP